MTVLGKQYGTVQRRVYTAMKTLSLATEKTLFAELKINTLLVKKYCNNRLLAAMTYRRIYRLCRVERKVVIFICCIQHCNISSRGGNC